MAPAGPPITYGSSGVEDAHRLPELRGSITGEMGEVVEREAGAEVVGHHAVS
jgi:hypothetical protein